MQRMAGTSKSKLALTDLDDGCLSRIFSLLTPLPDLFNTARVCQRFHSLATEGRMALLVTCTAPAAGATLFAANGRQCRSCHTTLQSALSCSRPGDTILIEPGQLLESPHSVSGCIISWPLHLIGAGASPEATLLRSPRGAETALDFRASAKLSNLSVHSDMGPCIIHRRGRLTVQNSVLCSHTSQALDHLITPLVTTATTPAAARRPTHVPRCATPPLLARAGGCDAPDVRLPYCQPRQPAAGILSVVETKIQGGRGSTAVSTDGSGQLRDVRLINLVHDTLFWFEVDSAYPGACRTALLRPHWASVLDCMANTQAAQQLKEAQAASALPAPTTELMTLADPHVEQQQQQALAADKVGQWDEGTQQRAKAWAARPLPGNKHMAQQAQQPVDEEAHTLQVHNAQFNSGAWQLHTKSAESVALPAKRMRLQ